MICKHCQKKNRPIAKFCKWCGEELIEHEDPFKDIVGMDEVKGQLQSIVDTYHYLMQRSDTKDIRVSANTIITGESGTGKTMLAGIICEYFYQHKIIKRDHVMMVDAVDYEKFIENWDSNIEEAKGGILFFDNAQKLLPDTYSDAVNPLDKLFVEMSGWNEDPIVIIAGLPKGLNEFFEHNHTARNRFKYQLQLPTYGFEEMTAICKNALRKQYGLEEFTPEASKKLLHFFKYKLKQKDATFAGGHLSLTTAEDIFTSFISRGISNDNLEVTEEDIRAYVPPILSAEEILAQMDEFIGAAEVKAAVREIANQVQASMVREQRGLGGTDKQAMHIVLTGNPGTGKTTIARKLGEIFEAIGYLDSGHVVEVDRSQMISPYKGETPKLVDALCDKAMGGILFVDEAYTLAPVKEDGSKDEQGTQALEKLMKRMEDDRGKFVVIAAGYKTEMENLFRVNPGIKSRFNRFLHIDDYTADELFQILECFVRKSDFLMDEGCKQRVKAAIGEMYANRESNFANGRAIRELFEMMSRRQAERVHGMNMDEVTNEQLLTFTAEDVPYQEREQVDLEKILSRFDNLVGMDSVRQEITNIATLINMQVRRGDNSLSAQHYVFTGNPGTGKTTVARIMAEVLHALGVVSRGQLVEADRSKLVAGFTGQTAIKTNQLIDSALGGVLFIDEAYMLCNSDSDTFGKEAIDTLLKRLEDDRGKFVCIVAGYTDQMHHFMQTNPGLSSRFTQTIFFPDYSAGELSQIFLNLAAGRNFVIEEQEMPAISQYFERVYATRQHNFGNARDVRKIFDTALRNQSQRLMSEMKRPDFRPEMMFRLTAEDIDGQNGENRKRPLEEVLAEMDEFVGMTEVKDAIRRLAMQITFLQERVSMGMGSMADMPAINIVLTGNPGTGKTSIARKLGMVLQSIGALPTSKVVECDRSTMVGKYQGETPKLTASLIDQAMGGILFIDEAYTLSQSGDQYGREAIETLMKRMEDDLGKFVVIVAGYQTPMEQFLDTNPGLSSRFNYRMHIPDYSISELVEIFRRLASKKDYRMSTETEFVLMQKVMQMYERRTQGFGNAREIRNLFDQTVQRLSVRVSQTPPELRTPETFSVIMPEDIGLE